MPDSLQWIRVRFAGCLLALVGLASCGGGDNPFWQTVLLKINAASLGTGTGRVIGDNALPFDLDCTIPPATTEGCSYTFEDAGVGGAFTLTAIADDGSVFVEWSGSCDSEKAGECQIACGADMKEPVCSVSFSQDAGDVTFYLLARFDLEDASATVLADDFDQASLCDNWTSTLWSSTGTVSTSEDCPATGGDGDSQYRQMTHQITGAGSLVVLHGFDGGTYDPSTQGAIKELRYSWWHKVVTPAFVGAGVGEAVGVLQDGKLYTFSLGAFTNTTWQPVSGTLTAGDFLPAPGPDFSASGGPIQFGYLRSNTNTSAASTQTMVHGMDNWRVMIVPE